MEVFLVREKSSDVIEEFEERIKIDSSFKDAYMGLKNTYRFMGDEQKATATQKRWEKQQSC